MFTKKFIGWIALVFFVIVAMTLGSLILLNFIPYLHVNAQLTLLFAGVFALAAAILGFNALSTLPGKVGGIGGLILTIVVTIVLMFTIIARVERGTAQQPPVEPATTPKPSTTVAPVIATTMHASTAIQIDTDNQTYHNNHTGFELDYPMGWLIETSYESSGTVMLWSRKVEGLGVDGVPTDVVKIDIVNPAVSVKSLDNLVTWEEQITADASNIVVHETQLQLPGGLAAVFLQGAKAGELMGLC